MKNDSYEFVAVLDYAEDGINITFPDIPEAISCADTTKEAMKNAEEVLGLVLYDMEYDNKKIPEATSLDNVKIQGNQKAIPVSVWMPLVRNELDEQAVKKTLTIPQWLNKMAESKNVNFSRLLQTALKEYLGVGKY